MDIVFLVLLGLAAGSLGSILGLGGGFLVVPALILIKGLDEHIATGTAIGVIVPGMLVALWRRGGEGHVDWKIAALVAVGAMIGAWFGSGFAARIDRLTLRRLFAGVLVVLAAVLAFTKPAAKSAPESATHEPGSPASPMR